MDKYLLTVLILLPIFGALAIAGHGLFAPYRKAINYRWIALIFSSLTFFVSLLTLRGDTGFNADFRFVQNTVWIGAIGANYHIGVDGISLWLIILTTLLMPISVLCSWTAIEKRPLAFYLSLLLLEGAVIGVFVSLDLLLFYLFFEASLIPMFFLIGVWGGERRIYAAVKFFIYTAIGSLLMLVAIIALFFIYGSFDYTTILASMRGLPALDSRYEFWLFAAFALAFSIKTPLFPFHTWLPDAHTEAPTAGSVILAGVLLKLGTYGLLRFNLGLFPKAAVAFAPLMVVLAVIGIIYGALVAMVQPDVKRLVAYSSVSHMGFVILGIFSFTEQGIQGALYQMLSHGVSTGALFLIVGIIYERSHTRLIENFGGLAKPMPWFSTFFCITTLSSIGLPLLNGFVGEFLVLLGTWTSNLLPYAWLITMLATTGVIWAAVYMLWMLQRVIFGKITRPENEIYPDLNPRETGFLLPLLALMLIMGVFPLIFIDRTRASVAATRNHIMQSIRGGSMLVGGSRPVEAGLINQDR
ncbi:MAG: complex I subunit 4 family protein [Pyrinomonadaceae bacterium]